MHHRCCGKRLLFIGVVVVALMISLEQLVVQVQNKKHRAYHSTTANESEPLAQMRNNITLTSGIEMTTTEEPHLKRVLNYVKSGLMAAKELAVGKPSRFFQYMLSTGDTNQRMFKNSTYKVAAEHEEHKNKESQRLGDLIQRRLAFLQNPEDCSKARKLVYSVLHTGGFGAYLHQLTFCLIRAYATNRTLIVESKGWKYAKEGWEAMFQPLSSTCTDTYGSSVEKWKENSTEESQVIHLPLDSWVKSYPDYVTPAIPDDLADKMMYIHSDPPVWWMGQFVKYLTRPQAHLAEHIEETMSRIGFENPIVGVHVRGTDKKIEAKIHGIENYMVCVEKWFEAYERREPGIKRNVYLASDEPGILKNARAMYPNYTFVSDSEVSMTAGVKTRYSKLSLRGIVQDLHFLSHCDFIVCTFSSNVGRAAYELMQTMHGDASQWYKSLDTMYFVNEGKRREADAIEDHEARSNIYGIEIDLRKDDVVRLLDNNYKRIPREGFLEGTNTRTGKVGLFPSYKIKNKLVRVKMPIYITADTDGERK